MHIVHIATEMARIAKVGGLGDVILGLPRQLADEGHQAEVILPKYSLLDYHSISDLQIAFKDLWSYGSGGWQHNTVWSGWVEGVKLYLIEPTTSAHYFNREQIYGYGDDVERFTYFARSALEFLLKSQINPDIIHLHDWQTAIAAPLYWDVFHALGLDKPGIVFTSHNLDYQGQCSPADLDRIGIPGMRYLTPDRLQDDTNPTLLNLTKGAFVYANWVTTVSPTYAKEVLTEKGSHGLHRTTQACRHKFEGILNGLDYHYWGPEIDPYLPAPYGPDPQTFGNKERAQQELRKRLSLNQEKRPIVGSVTRLVPQKGIELIRKAIFRTLELGGQFVLMGTAPIPSIAEEFQMLKVRFSDNSNVHLELQHNEELAHLIFAGSDMFVVPSIFEPCGLTQMIAMRYGSVPIVRRTGGLADTVFDVDDASRPFAETNGYVFEEPTEEALGRAMARAVTCWKRDPKRWRQIMLQGMQTDCSWKKSVQSYLEIYSRVQKMLHRTTVTV